MTGLALTRIQVLRLKAARVSEGTPKAARVSEGTPSRSSSRPLPKTAPYIEAYFNHLMEYHDSITVRLFKDPKKLMNVAYVKHELEKIEEGKQHLISKLIPLIHQCFKRHDVNDNGVLDERESAHLFSSFVSNTTDFTKTISDRLLTHVAALMMTGVNQRIAEMEDTCQEVDRKLKEAKQVKLPSRRGRPDDDVQQLEMRLQEFERISEKEKERLQDAIGEELASIPKLFAWMKEEVKVKEKEYIRNKSERDAAAFKVMDKNHDGQIQLREFVAALTPDTPKNQEFLTALGYDFGSQITCGMDCVSGFRMPELEVALRV